MLLITKNLYWNEASIRPWGLIYLFHNWKVLLTTKVIKWKTIRLSNKSENIFFHLRLELSAQLFEFWVIYSQLVVHFGLLEASLDTNETLNFFFLPCDVLSWRSFWKFGIQNNHLFTKISCHTIILPPPLILLTEMWNRKKNNKNLLLCKYCLHFSYSF